jgi:hypothetical protein
MVPLYLVLPCGRASPAKVEPDRPALREICLPGPHFTKWPRPPRAATWQSSGHLVKWLGGIFLFKYRKVRRKPDPEVAGGSAVHSATLSKHWHGLGATYMAMYYMVASALIIGLVVMRRTRESPRAHAAHSQSSSLLWLAQSGQSLNLGAPGATVHT